MLAMKVSKFALLAAVVTADIVSILAARVPAQQTTTPPAAGRSGAAPATVIVPPGKPTVFLWPNGAPGSEARRNEPEQIQAETILNVHNPSIVVFLPRKEIS